MSPWCQSSQSCTGSGGTGLSSEAFGCCKILPWMCCPARCPWAPQQGRQTFVQTHERTQTQCHGHKEAVVKMYTSRKLVGQSPGSALSMIGLLKSTAGYDLDILWPQLTHSRSGWPRGSAWSPSDIHVWAGHILSHRCCPHSRSGCCRSAWCWCSVLRKKYMYHWNESKANTVTFLT